ncbi:hypothetical protein KCU95_g4393, partial [Aureobasidium melanogenum]
MKGPRRIRTAPATPLAKEKAKVLEEALVVITQYKAPLQKCPGEDKVPYFKALRGYGEARMRLCPSMFEIGKDNKLPAGYCNLADTASLRYYVHCSQDWVINAIGPYLDSVKKVDEMPTSNKGPILNQLHQRANTRPITHFNGPDSSALNNKFSREDSDDEVIEEVGDESLTLYEHYLAGLFDRIIGDEAHKAKNKNTKIYKALIEARANSHILITGTPMSNKLYNFEVMIRMFWQSA